MRRGASSNNKQGKEKEIKKRRNKRESEGREDEGKEGKRCGRRRWRAFRAARGAGPSKNGRRMGASAPEGPILRAGRAEAASLRTAVQSQY